MIKAEALFVRHWKILEKIAHESSSDDDRLNKVMLYCSCVIVEGIRSEIDEQDGFDAKIYEAQGGKK